ncbi:MAG: hypothetical protein U0003_02305 [Vampirovibrionales bacterium]
MSANPFQKLADPLSVMTLSSDSGFTPKPPTTWQEVGVSDLWVEGLLLKWLLAKNSMTGHAIAKSLCLPYTLVEVLLQRLKQKMSIAHKSTTALGDFDYQLTDDGRARALIAREESAYLGPVPVPLHNYIESIKAQSVKDECPDEARLRAAFDDLTMPDYLFDILGPAVASGKGLFLYGEPGNGKTSVAERICRSFNSPIWIPVTLMAEGQVIQFYDSQCHEKTADADNIAIAANTDTRWVKIERPAVVVGGELTLETLDIQLNRATQVAEAPLQLKANGGVFLIDDFGRQIVQPAALLNRWIVPLEKRVDFLTLPNGQKITVPFDPLIIFSTNLDPKDLVDDAFLRRIPYKIHIENPSQQTFETIMKIMAKKLGVEYSDHAFQYLVENHYKGKRPFRACQARDLLDQVLQMARYKRQKAQMTNESLNAACSNYFSAMGQ